MAFTRPKAAQIDFDLTNITDPIIRLNSGQSGSADKDVGIVIERGSDTNVALLYDESADEFVLVNTSEDGTTSGNVTISSYADLKVGQIYTTGEVNIGGNLTVQGTTTTVDVTNINITNSFSFEGATADGFETTLTVADPTADRTITLPDVTGYAAILQSDPGTTLVTATVAELNLLDGVTATTAELNYTDGVTSNIQTQLDAKLALAGGTMSGAIAMGTSKITGMGDPTAAQDAATKAYVDTQVSSVPTGDITAVNITAGTGLSGTVSTASGDHTQTLTIDSTVATLTGSQTLTNKTLTLPTIGGTGASFSGSTSGATTLVAAAAAGATTITMPATTGTMALTSDIPSAVSELTNDSGYSTTTGTVTSVAGAGTVNGLTLSGTVTSSGNITLGGTFSATVSEISDLTATAAELNYTDGVTSNIQTQLDAKAPLAAPAFTGTATGVNLTLSGDLTVNGTTTTVNTTNLVVTDNLIELNNGAASNANDSGIVIERGSTGDNAIIAWDESADKFVVGTTTATGASTGDLTITTGTLIANIEGNVTGDVTGNVTGSSGSTTGNAATATALETARNIAGQSFNGTANITIASTDLSDTASIVLTTASQTLTNKTLTTPIISSISNTGTLTLPTSTDTLVGRATTDTLTNKTLTSPQINTNADLLARGEVRFYDTDSSNYVALRASGTVTSNLTFSLPTAYGDNEQVLTTDGAGGTSWTTASGGGGSTGFTNSTVTTAPGSSGNYDLAEGPAQDGDETPFEAGSVDAFGVNLGTIYDCMEPVGSTTTVDYGDSEAYVGA